MRKPGASLGTKNDCSILSYSIACSAWPARTKHCSDPNDTMKILKGGDVAS